MRPDKNTLFPVFFKLERLHSLIVGGGDVGLEKLTALLSNAPEANITLVGKHISNKIKQYAATYSGVTLHEKPFTSSDLDQVDLVIVATDNPEINQQIYSLAKEKGLLVNVADTPHICDFYLGSIVQKGNLKIAISTNGQSPTMAKRMREVLTDTIPDEMESVLQNLRSIRDSLKGDFAYKVKALNEITSVIVADNEEKTSI